jgi:signal transduction histidine kinase
VRTDDPERILRAGMLPGLVDAAIDGTGPNGPARRTTRDLLVDAVFIFILLAAAMGLIGLLAPGTHGTVHTVVSAIALALSCTALLVRRRYAVTLAAILIIASVWLPVVSGASLIALFTAAVHRRVSLVLPLVALAALSTLAQLRIGPELAEPLYWPAVAVTLLITLLVVGWGVATRARRQIVLMMAERIQRLQAEQEARLQAARQAVRERIARDMHDSLAHRLSLITMSAGTLEFRGATPPEDMADMIGIVRTNAQLALAELREVVTALRDAETDDAAGPGGTARLAERIAGLVDQARDSGQRVEYHWRVPDDLPAGLGESVFRVVQEGLSNRPQARARQRRRDDRRPRRTGDHSGLRQRPRRTRAPRFGRQRPPRHGRAGRGRRRHRRGGRRTPPLPPVRALAAAGPRGAQPCLTRSGCSSSTTTRWSAPPCG